jgi:hypothetical protein
VWSPRSGWPQARSQRNPATDDDQTEDEIDVLRLIAAGNANKQIADQLSVTEETVKAASGTSCPLGANDRTHAATIALKRGIIELQLDPAGFAPADPGAPVARLAARHAASSSEYRVLVSSRLPRQDELALA